MPLDKPFIYYICNCRDVLTIGKRLARERDEMCREIRRLHNTFFYEFISRMDWFLELNLTYFISKCPYINHSFTIFAIAWMF